MIRRLGHRAIRRLEWSAAALRAYLRGWRCRSRILVIESDDWGAIRTASREARDCLADMGYAMHRSKYSLDALETDEDMKALLEVLGRVRDHWGRPACMTANVIMANPDFERIRESDFEEYFFEPMAATLARSDARGGVAAKWAEGARRRLFVPQLHGREHLRWWKWMEALRGGSQEARATFDLEMCGVPFAASKEGLAFYASPYVSDQELKRHRVDLDVMVRDGAKLFEQQFGFASASAIAPCYCWTPHVERIWSLLGIRYIQGELFQDVGGTGRKSHYLGERGVAGAWYLVRNCHFEPAQEGRRALERCLRHVARAFRSGRPAIVSSHRVNFIGAIEPENRTSGLALLQELLATVQARWPDVRFLSSPELGEMIEHDIPTVEAFRCGRLDGRL